MTVLDATWFRVACELLRFAAANMPSGSSREGLAPGQPEATLVVASSVAKAAFSSIRTVGSGAVDSGEIKLSHASKEDRERLRTIGGGLLTLLADEPFNVAMKETTVALGLAEALDELTSHTFMSWFKGEGELSVTAGTVYPIHGHDPSGWLGKNPLNTEPGKFPRRGFASTAHLQVATGDAAEYSYVLDFDCWDVLSDFGVEVSDGEENISYLQFVAAVGQTNANLDEFNIELSEAPPFVYRNRGPLNDDAHAQLVGNLIASARKAQVLVLPEYCLTGTSRDLVIEALSKEGKVPRLVISGVSSGADEDGYIVNEAVMIIATAAGHVSRVITLPQKIHPAEIEPFKEYIKQGSEVRVFISERWTIATLICFDAMTKSIIGQLAQFGVNLLLVPALSPKSAALVGSATSLCTTSQAFVVIATGPARFEHSNGITSRPELRSEAVFGGPYGSGDVTRKASSAPGAAPAERVNLWMFNYTQRRLTSHAVHNS